MPNESEYESVGQEREMAVPRPGTRRRGVLALSLVVAGFALQIVTYIFLAAPWGFPPRSVEYSNPAFPFAPVLFIVGVILVFLAAVVYEIFPERKSEA